MTLNPEFAFPALWNPCLRTGTMILIVHLVMCELPHLPQFWWSDTLTAGVLMQWRVGRDTGVFEIPLVHLNRFWSCIYICIKLLNVRPGLDCWITQLVSRVHTRLGVVMSLSAHDIMRPDTGADLITPRDPQWCAPPGSLVPGIIFRFFSNNGHCGGIKINNEVLRLRPFLHSAKEIHFWLDIGCYLISLLMRLTWPASRSLYSPRLTLTAFLAHYFTIFNVCKVQDLSKNKSVNCFMDMS